VLLAQFIFKAAFLAGLAAVACRWMSGRKNDGRMLAAGLVAWLGASVVALFMLSPLSLPYAPLYQRHIVFLTVPAALVIGAVCAELGRRKGAALMALFLVTLLPFVADVAGNDALWDQHHRLREAGEYISEHGGPGDLAIASFSSARSDLAHYVREDIPVVAMVPLSFYGNDLWDSRRTLGLLENESQVRFRGAASASGLALGGAPTEKVASADQSVTPSGIERKLDVLDRRYAPQRVWLYGFADKDYAVHGWFKERGWHRGFAAIGSIFPLDMYVRP
jgi:hypothetical protein